MTTGTKIRGIDIKNNQYILFDWIQGTTHNCQFSVYDLFAQIFKIASINVIESAGGLFGYDTTYSYKNIKIFECSYREDMGFHLYLTGAGCRDLEDLGLDYWYVFTKLIDLGFSFTRVDISIDDYGESYSLDQVTSCIREGEVSSKFKNSIEFVKTNLNSGDNEGYTIWFGSRSSDIQIVFYDKLKERESQSYIVDNDITSWNRLECRFRNKRAVEMIHHFCSNSFQAFKEIYKGVILNYIRFVDFSPTDSVKSRWKTKKWWSEFLDNVDKMPLQKINVESSIIKSKNFMLDYMSHTEFKVFLSEIPDLTSDDISSDYIYNMLKRGFKLITEQDIQFINEHRLKSKLEPLERADIESLIRSIREVSVKTDKNTS